MSEPGSFVDALKILRGFHVEERRRIVDDALELRRTQKLHRGGTQLTETTQQLRSKSYISQKLELTTY